MSSIYRAIADLIDSGEVGALCTVINSDGSTPRHEGSKMLVYGDGKFIGTVGGGEMESRVFDCAVLARDDAFLEQSDRLGGAVVIAPVPADRPIQPLLPNWHRRQAEALRSPPKQSFLQAS